MPPRLMPALDLVRAAAYARVREWSRARRLAAISLLALLVVRLMRRLRGERVQQQGIGLGSAVRANGARPQLWTHSGSAWGSSSTSWGTSWSPTSSYESVRCGLCGSDACYWKVWVRVVLRSEGWRGGAALKCHLDCICAALIKGGDAADVYNAAGWLMENGGGTGKPSPALCTADDIHPHFAEEIRTLLELSPQLRHRWPLLRLCSEDTRLCHASESWPPREPPRPPPAAFAFEGLTEIRISSCATLRELPPEIGRCRSVMTLVLLSNSLESLPEEVGDLRKLEQLFLNGNFLRELPAKVGTLPELQEFSIDANQLESMPPITSTKLTLFSAPANNLKSLPLLTCCPQRLEVHGNALVRLDCAPPEKTWWQNMRCLKIMGNEITELPEEVGLMRGLHMLSVSGNRLKALPDSVADLRRLETLYAYHNAIDRLPDELLLGSQKLDTVLLEGNPLTGATLMLLISDAHASRARTVALDTSQARKYQRATSSTAPNLAELPQCISIGDLLDTGASARYYMKLVRVSQLRRLPGVRAAGIRGGPASAREAPAELLVAGFAASQGDPEWMGVVRRLVPINRGSRLPPQAGPLSDVTACAKVGNGTEADARLASLWSSCVARDLTGFPMLPMPPHGNSSMMIEDFDMLSVIDHRMRWYAQDSRLLERVLQSLVPRYKRSLFLGASMGGFGALLHGGALADAVLAFGPQTRIDQAILRPPGSTIHQHEELSQRSREAAALGVARGAFVEVHCAADEHFWHALNLPLADSALTVHPMMPRKPFAKMLDSAGLLAPILVDAILRVVERPASIRGSWGDALADMGEEASPLSGAAAARAGQTISSPPLVAKLAALPAVGTLPPAAAAALDAARAAAASALALNSAYAKGGTSTLKAGATTLPSANGSAPPAPRINTAPARADVLLPSPTVAALEALSAVARATVVAMAAAPPESMPPARILVARWNASGFSRHSSSRSELLHLFFGPGASEVPRPGDWFCARCSKRNMATKFFCRACGIGVKDADISNPDALRVPGGRSYPQPGDWGCGACGSAQTSYASVCSSCKAGREESEKTLVMGEDVVMNH
eukprot:NODE_161_length_3488_cov_4.828622.p1 GENE.NODE_161_length_3488_cov_4.828622~~NODE_161_length_3488_cov_4.828622.p1  ORF type:complete len:1077 (+),score=356.02 NODE_161_length_3488_cov_4.828622:78-3308(+)